MSPTPKPDPVPEADNGRDSQGRFAKGNAGGPGNPYYRRQAELKRRMLESVTDEDVLSVMRVLLGLARGGDLAAIKLFLEYTVGKPTKEVDPDKEELHEWQLQQQTPRLQQVLEVAAQGIEAPRANQVTRDLVAIVGDCNLQTVSKVLRDGTDFHGHRYGPPLEETPSGADRDGGKRPSASARRMAEGVRSTVQTGDIGVEEDTWQDEEPTPTVPTGDIGGLLRMLQRFRSGDTGPERPGGAGPD